MLDKLKNHTVYTIESFVLDLKQVLCLNILLFLNYDFQAVTRLVVLITKINIKLHNTIFIL